MPGHGRPDGLRRGSREDGCELKGGQRDRRRRDHRQSKPLQAPTPGGPHVAWTQADTIQPPRYPQLYGGEQDTAP
jgi:hypothetical protein